MAETSATLEAAPSDVWAVLNDPKTFQYFVVGTKRVRRHDPDWPRPGASLEHSTGVGPLVLHDSSTVIESEPERRLLLEVRFRPLGVATVEFRLQNDDTGEDVAADGEPGRNGATLRRTAAPGDAGASGASGDAGVSADRAAGPRRTVLVVDERPLSGPIALPLVRRITAGLFVLRNRELLRRINKLAIERSR